MGELSYVVKPGDCVWDERPSSSFVDPDPMPDTLRCETMPDALSGVLMARRTGEWTVSLLAQQPQGTAKSGD